MAKSKVLRAIVMFVYKLAWLWFLFAITLFVMFKFYQQYGVWW